VNVADMASHRRPIGQIVSRAYAHLTLRSSLHSDLLGADRPISGPDPSLAHSMRSELRAQNNDCRR